MTERPASTLLPNQESVIEGETLYNFVGLVLASIRQFKLEIKPEAGNDLQALQDFAHFYCRYLEDFETWSLDLRSRIQPAFAMLESGMIVYLVQDPYS